MNRHSLIFLLTLAPLVAVGCGDSEDDTSSSGGGGANTQNGEQVFAATCGVSSCHGSDGNNGTAGSNLSEVVPPLSESQLKDVIQNGTGTMAPVTSLSDQDVDDVVAYVIANFK